MTWVPESVIHHVRPNVRKLYYDFGVLKAGRYGCPPNFNQLTPAWYMNGSSTRPNVRVDRNYDFIASRNISRGEELTVDYSEYSENEGVSAATTKEIGRTAAHPARLSMRRKRSTRASSPVPLKAVTRVRIP
jgi:hypothetical protein